MKNLVKFLNFSIDKLFIQIPDNRFKEMKAISKDIAIEMKSLPKTFHTARFNEEKVANYDIFGGNEHLKFFSTLDKIYEKANRLNYDKLLEIDKLKKTNKTLHNDNSVLCSDNRGLQQHNKELVESYNNTVTKFNDLNVLNQKLVGINKELVVENDTLKR